MSILIFATCCYSVILSLRVYSGKMSPMNKREETYHMTDKEMARAVVAERLVEGEITIKDAAEVLGLSTRQVKRIKKGVILIGPKAVIHGNRKRKPVNAVTDDVKDLVVELKTKKYAGTNFSHFAELLEEREGIDISQPTAHRILRSAGIVSPKKKKKIRAHRYRKRKDCPGMMVQLDASPYPIITPKNWTENEVRYSYSKGVIYSYEKHNKKKLQSSF